MENRNYKKKPLKREYLTAMQKNQILKVKYSLLESEKDFIDLKDIELKDKEIEAKREIKKLFFKRFLFDKENKTS